MQLNTRALNFLGAFICYQLIVTAMYFQYVEFMEPCPLCMFSRFAIGSLGVVLLINAIFQPRHESIFNKALQILGMISAAMGIWISAKHVHIQSLPEDQVMDCGAPLEMLVEVMPLTEVFTTVMMGDGKCAKVNFEWLGLTMPGWMLVIFCIAFLVMLYRLIQALKEPKHL